MLDRVLKVCLAKVPEDRWQSARDLLRELRWTAEADARQVSSKARHSIKWMATTFFLLAGSIVLLGVYLVWTREALRFLRFSNLRARGNRNLACDQKWTLFSWRRSMNC